MKTKVISRKSNSSDTVTQSSHDELFSFINSSSVVALDTETTSLDPHSGKLLTIQIGNRNRQFIIAYDRSDEVFNDRLRKALTSDTLFILHNASFDLQFLWSHGLDIKNLWDTMVAELVLKMGLINTTKFDLASVVRKYLNINLSKDERSHFRYVKYPSQILNNPALVKYCFDDVAYLTIVYNKQLQQCIKYKYYNTKNPSDIYTVIGLEMALVRVIASMQYEGMYLDKSALTEAKTQLSEHLSLLYNKIIDEIESLGLHRYIDRQLSLFNTQRKLTINLSSPSQKLELLRNVIPYLSSVDKNELSQYKDSYDIVKYMIEYSETLKILTSFIDSLPSYINPVTGRVHSKFFQVRNANRLSSSSPNLQNIPSKGEVGKVIRACFKPKPGYSFVIADYSGCELRILAKLSGDENWIKFFKEGRDLHSELCSLTFNIPIDRVRDPFPPNPKIDYRTVQKTVNFGLVYGMGPSKLANTIKVDVEEAKSIINKFFQASKGVADFLSSMESFAIRKQYITTPPPYRRRRWLYYNKEDSAQRAAVGRKGKNTPIQGGNGEMIKLALVLIHRYIEQNDYPCRIVNCIHDEVICEVKDEYAQEWMHIQQELMLRAAATILEDVPMNVDPQVCKFWKK